MEFIISSFPLQQIDISIVSLTSPSAFWGSEDVSVECAQIINDDMAAAQIIHPDRIRFLATLPWEYPQHAVKELERAKGLGAVGIMTLANIRGKFLNDPLFDPFFRNQEARLDG